MTNSELVTHMFSNQKIEKVDYVSYMLSESEFPLPTLIKDE